MAAPLARNYREGEVVADKMQAINEGHQRTVRYEAQAEGQAEGRAALSACGPPMRYRIRRQIMLESAAP
jgi:hypothetical protein